MTNKEISKALKLSAALGELHEENDFKLKSLTNASFQIDRYGEALEGKSMEQLVKIPGIGKGIAEKILELIETGTSNDLQHYLQITPAGVVGLLSVKGIGPKKVKTLWHEMGIESPGELLYACNENRLITAKGFGVKTQDSIRQALEFNLSNSGKLHFAEAEIAAQEIIRLIEVEEPNWRLAFTGELRRKMEVVDQIELIADVDADALEDVLGRLPLASNTEISDEFVQTSFADKYRIHIYWSDLENFERDQLIRTGPADHLQELDLDPEEPVISEESFYDERGFPFIIPELRDLPIDEAASIDASKLVQFKDIIGVLHNHSTWSDGADSLEEMAIAARDLGLKYLGICDHSRTASYAGGLSIDRVYQQWTEIASLNSKLGPFHIFKGIESDILSDGSLDYPDEVLAGFDLVVASIHSIFGMDEERATSRLIKAIENPYTTILGHPTGRLLLSRKGYPINHKKVIDACAANSVIMELNAHPYRLDIDWRWIPYCLERGVKISINPDAHRKAGYLDMHYGINVARKAGLTPEMMFNALTLSELTEYLKK
jgi:DNA polymerase (family 10)